MGPSGVLGRKLLLAFLWAICTTLCGTAQDLFDEVDYLVYPSCINPFDGKSAVQDKYFITFQISSIGGSAESFEILFNGEREMQVNVSSVDLPYENAIGPYPHSGFGGDYNTVTIRSLDSELSDDLIIGEAVCGYYTSFGDNMAGYFCSEEGFDLIAQSVPERISDESIPQKQYVYVLLDKETDLVAQVNKSGLFKDVNDLNLYEIHAFSLPYSRADEFLTAMIIGQPLDSDAPEICFAFCGVFEEEVRCSTFDLALEKELASGDVLSLGDTVTYSIEVINEGIDIAYDVVVRDMIPEGLVFLTSLNDGWNDDVEYVAIDSILPGKSEIIEISLIIDLVSPFIEIINDAEIIFGTKVDDSGIQAYDVDSTPDNEDETEDDQDEVTITILENLCNETFDVSFDKHPVCDDGDIIIEAVVMMATLPVRYVWVRDGIIISTDQTLVIHNPKPEDFGQYGLTVLDANKCQSSELITVAPVTDDPFACLSEINISITQECQLNLSPSNLISQQISGIEDYILLIKHPDGREISIDDIADIKHGDVLQVAIIHPCSGQTICWTSVNVEFKLTPQFDYYMDTSHVSCFEITELLPTAIIEEYNTRHDPILSGEAFKELMEETTCQGGWKVEAIDEFVGFYNGCSNNLISRTYKAVSSFGTAYLDTAYLLIESLDLDKIHFPNDLSNMSCDAPIDPETIYSYPFYIVGDDTLFIQVDPDAHANGLATKYCNVALNYTDEILGTSCAFGANKILRKWRVIDWCNNGVKDAEQFIFIIDEHPPELILSSDTITFHTEVYSCVAKIDLSSYIGFWDNCDYDPKFGIVSDLGFEMDWTASEVPVGDHHVKIYAEDNCHNKIERNITIRVLESTPPVPVLLEDVVLTFTTSMSNSGLWIYPDQFDSGSHDFGCGPVSLKIARYDEVLQVKEATEPVSSDMVIACEGSAIIYDNDDDGFIQVEEIFRDKALICCEDIGSSILIAIRVTDQFGNYTDASAMLFIDVKENVLACDDDDPCTINDFVFGDCPCRGEPDTRDFDLDGIPDCGDEEIVLCFDDETVTVKIDEAQEYIDMGALPGPCADITEAAMISGAVYTSTGDMVQYVEVNNSDLKTYTTGTDGAYHFAGNPMYRSYNLTPYRNDDAVNGVTALDLVILQEHILGITNLNDPLKLLAGDATGDGRVSAADLIELKSLILGIKNEFSNNRSWRFVPVANKPLQGESPFPFTEQIVISSLVEDREQEDWFGIKIGDISGDASPNDLKSSTRSKGSLSLYFEDRWINKGDKIEVSVYGNSDQMVRAFQFGLELPGFLVTELISGQIEVNNSDFALHGPLNDQMTIVWYEHKGVPFEGQLFSIMLEAKEGGQIKNMIALDEHITKNIFYYHDTDERYEMNVEFIEAQLSDNHEGLILYQNKPNPFSGTTVIEFELPQQADVHFTFFNVAGELLYEIEDHFERGLNAIQVEDSDLNHVKGIVYYQIEYGGKVISKSMIVGVK